MPNLVDRAFHTLRNWQVRQRQLRDFENWQRNGCPNPTPHLIKQRMLREHALRLGLKILVETGTYRGDMVHAMRHDFEKIYSIELSAELHQAAQERFLNVKHVEILHGSSGTVIAELLPRLDKPTLFWLDGHCFAGDKPRGGEKFVPILEELGHILRSGLTYYAVIIDDARLFGADPTYPTLQALKDYVSALRPTFDIEVKTDSIRITFKDVVRKVA